jgi:hypothetical protein
MKSKKNTTRNHNRRGGFIHQRFPLQPIKSKNPPITPANDHQIDKIGDRDQGFGGVGKRVLSKGFQDIDQYTVTACVDELYWLSGLQCDQ